MSDAPAQKESIAALRAEVAGVGPEAKRLAPVIGELAESFAYGQVWSRTEELSKRDRSIATIAALVVLNCPDLLKVHVLQGLENGLTKQEIAEILTQLTPYAGFPLVATGAAAVADIVERADV